MASKIPSLSLDAPGKLIHVKDFKVSGDFSIFPPEFLPDGTTINVKSKVVGETYELSWTDGKGQACSIADLTWTREIQAEGPPLGLNGGLNEQPMAITVGGQPLPGSPVVNITPTEKVDGPLRTWQANITLDKDSTPTTGTFVAQTSTDGGNDGDLVTYAARASTDS